MADKIIKPQGEKKRRFPISAAAAVVAAAALLLYLLAGGVSAEVDDSILTVKAFLDGSEISVADIKEAKLIDAPENAVCRSGFRTAKYTAGEYYHVLIGEYKLFSYADADRLIAVVTDDQTVVFSLKTENETEMFYKKLCEILGYDKNDIEFRPSL